MEYLDYVYKKIDDIYILEEHFAETRVETYPGTNTKIMAVSTSSEFYWYADFSYEAALFYLENKAALDALADKVVYTGPIDAYFDYKLGTLEYRSVRFETEELPMENFQGNAVVNYTAREVPYTRIIEHKHFEFGTQPTTIISREYSSEWKPGMVPYYAVNNEETAALYARYKALADQHPDLIFGGRLGHFKYYDMDKVIKSALEEVEREVQ